MSNSRLNSLIIFALLACAANGALAGNASVAWGTGGTSADPMLRSASLHALEDQIAESVAKAKTWNQSITACGICTYYNVTGDNNTISGNSITASNSGSISANGSFNNSYDWGW